MSASFGRHLHNSVAISNLDDLANLSTIVVKIKREGKFQCYNIPIVVFEIPSGGDRSASGVHVDDQVSGSGIVNAAKGKIVSKELFIHIIGHQKLWWNTQGFAEGGGEKLPGAVWGDSTVDDGGIVGFSSVFVGEEEAIYGSFDSLSDFSSILVCRHDSVRVWVVGERLK